jgi:hypothetical protein
MFSYSSRLFPKNSSQLVFHRSLSWQFWQSSPTVTAIDPWPANITSGTSESITIAPTTSTIVTDQPKIEADEFGYIPEPPVIPSDIPIEFLLNAAGEPALSTLGLGKWYLPTGWIQQGLDLIHANVGLPWWGTIIIGTILLSTWLNNISQLTIFSFDLGTLVIRMATTPIAIYNQRNAAQMQIHMPKLQELQGRMQAARIRNDQLASMWSLVCHCWTMKHNQWEIMFFHRLFFIV